MKQPDIYLDHAATSPMDPIAIEHLTELLKSGVANSSSAHRSGSKAAALLQVARETIASKLFCQPQELVFCSGGTEANNWVLQRLVSQWTKSSHATGALPHVITASTEHSSVSTTAAWLKSQGLAEWTEAKVDATGYIDLPFLRSIIQPNTVLVSISHGNNEIGTIQDLAKIGAICREQNVRFHADACQSFCHVEFNVSKLPVDLMTLSGHKIRGPKGIGALYVRKGVELSPLLIGGKQEKGLRPGTVPVELISAFAKASAGWNSQMLAQLSELKAFAQKEIQRRFSSAVFNGEVRATSLSHILSFTLVGYDSKVLHQRLAEAGVACSTGAACGTGKSDKSAVLLALGREESLAHQIRISFSPSTSAYDVSSALDRLQQIVSSL